MSRILFLVKSFLYQIDFFKSQILLRSKEENKVSTPFFGIFSLLIFSLFAALFIVKFINIINFDGSEISHKKYKQQRNSNLTYPSNLMFGIGMKLNNISFSELPNYFTPFAQIIRLNSTGSTFEQKVQMVPCTLNHWRNTDNDSIILDSQLPTQYFCLPDVLSEVTANRNKNILTIKLAACTLKPTCKQFSQIQQYYKSLLQQDNGVIINIRYINSYAQPSQTIPYQYGIREFSYKIGENNSFRVFVYFNRLKIITDTSYWPILTINSQNKTIIKCQRHVVIEEFPSLLSKPLTTLQILLTYDEQVYSRKITKLDDALSYVGGLLGIIVVVLIFLLRSYNEVRYQICVASNTFNFDNDGYKIREEDFNIFKYIRYRIFYIIYLVTGYKPKWGDCWEMEASLFQAKKLLDVEGMYRRLDMMERVLWSVFDFDLLMINTLQKPNNIEEVNKKRRTLEYYNEIIKMQNAATVEDAVRQDPKSFNYLDRSKRKLSKNRQNIDQVLRQISLNNIVSKQEQDIESEQAIEKSFIEDLKMQGLQAQCGSIVNYPLIYLQAKDTILDEKYEQIEEELTQSFINLTLQQKRNAIDKIPLKILHRLRLRVIKMKQKSKKSQKGSQTNLIGQQQSSNQLFRASESF